MDAFASYRRREFRGVEELRDAAVALVERFSAETERATAHLSITERTVRQYLSEDLLGEPATGQGGTALVFNYGNLLRLLAVKKLLAAHWSVVKVKEFMTALDTASLEQIVSGTLRSGGASASGAPDTSETGERALNIHASERNATTPDHAATPTPALASLAIESARRTERTSMEWIELAPGLEIKVRRGFRPPRNEEERTRLAARFWSVVNRNKEQG
jgi:DNA-binding transcriptional MerR regulator